MRLADIYAACATRYQSGAFNSPDYWPNDDKNPTAGQRHARVWFLPAQNDAGSLGGSGVDVQTGILQVDLIYPTNIGIGNMLDEADAIASHFQRGHSQDYDGQCVQFTGTNVTAPRNEDGWLRTIISIGWYAHVARSVT